MESAELQIHSSDNPTYCSQCESEGVIFGMVSSDFVCSSCGCVVNVRILHAEGVTGAANASKYSDRTRTDMPESLATHHKGLSTLIAHDDTHARGKMLEPAQKMKMRRLRTWNNMSQLNDSISRNLEKALKFLNNFGDKLYLSQAVIESAAFIERQRSKSWQRVVDAWPCRGLALCGVQGDCHPENRGRRCDSLQHVKQGRDGRTTSSS